MREKAVEGKLVCAVREQGGERGKRCPGGAFAKGESDPNESIEASSGLQRKQGLLRRAAELSKSMILGEEPMTAGGRKFIGSEVNRKGVSSPAESHDL